MWRNGNPLVLLMGMQTGAALWKAVWKFLKKLKIELPYDPVNTLLLGAYPQNTKTLIQRDTCTSVFIEALFTVAKL